MIRAANRVLMAAVYMLLVVGCYIAESEYPHKWHEFRDLPGPNGG